MQFDEKRDVRKIWDAEMEKKKRSYEIFTKNLNMRIE